ncbi:MAG: peptide chain release factor N(5)-glutamine methyltransferase, partial [Candidatus Zixiibacteriota bacterium]
MTALRLRPLLRQAAERLHAAGIDVGAAEAEIALCYLLDCERLDLYLSGDGRITPEIERRFEEIVARRETRYPLQYILGEAYFYGRRFVVNESV